MLKLIPFGLVFLILPESIPLWVIYVPSMIPSTCIKETQLLKQRAKLEKVRQRMNMNTLKSAEQIDGVKPSDFLSIVKFHKIAKSYGYDFELNQIDRRHLSSYCEFMGLNDWGTQGILQRRLDKHMKYITQDDMLLKDHGVDNLSRTELSHAIEERGMRSIDVEEEQMKKALKYWVDLNTNTEQVIPPGLMVFSRMFLLNAKY
ncbi:hypothetical protein K501DRAFT_185975 [Backusella circina FSU 941]|nr:hypothetical protein K501DRAFT_185975 [Backusella circina FSU 941]